MKELLTAYIQCKRIEQTLIKEIELKINDFKRLQHLKSTFKSISYLSDSLIESLSKRLNCNPKSLKFIYDFEKHDIDYLISNFNQEDL
jgi:hypothetical protein